MPHNNIQSAADEPTSGCRRRCPAGDCYCAELTYREANSVCALCGGHDGDCYCGEF